jgi:hypothetical protein
MVSAFNVNAMPNGERPPLGINAAKEHCHFNTEDDSFSHMGPAKVSLTTNKNFVMAKCKAEYNQDDYMDGASELEDAVVERDDISCRIVIANPDSTAKPKMFHYDGMGGFTVTPSGHIIGRCKASK